MPLMMLSECSRGVQLVKLADAATGEPAGRFTIDAACGIAAARFWQGMAKITGRDMLYLTARRKDRKFPARLICANLDVPSVGSSGTPGVLESIYNNFVDAGWEPVFEDPVGGRMWTVEISDVEESHARRPAQEDACVLLQPGTGSPEDAARRFRAQF